MLLSIPSAEKLGSALFNREENMVHVLSPSSVKSDGPGLVLGLFRAIRLCIVLGEPPKGWPCL